MVKCRHCGAENYVKNGLRGKHQLYYCKSCKHCFTITEINKGYEAQKLLALILYGSGKASYRYLAKLFCVCPATIMNWIKTFSEKIDLLEPCPEIKEIEIDEMWHFIDTKKTNYGSLKPLIELVERQLHGLQEGEMPKQLSNYMKR